MVGRLDTRAIGRGAIREELARGAFPRFCEDGFDQVTLEELAAGAGVSRSTFLRYFGSKEEVVLFVFDPLGEAIAEQVRAGGGDDWGGLRRAVEPVVASLGRDPSEGLTLLGLVARTPALLARLREKQSGWQALLTEELRTRPEAGRESELAIGARVAAALECLVTALLYWVDRDGATGLGAVVDEAFAAVRPLAPATDG